MRRPELCLLLLDVRKRHLSEENGSQCGGTHEERSVPFRGFFFLWKIVLSLLQKGEPSNPLCRHSGLGVMASRAILIGIALLSVSATASEYCTKEQYERDPALIETLLVQARLSEALGASVTRSWFKKACGSAN